MYYNNDSATRQHYIHLATTLLESPVNRKHGTQVHQLGSSCGVFAPEHLRMVCVLFGRAGSVRSAFGVSLCGGVLGVCMTCGQHPKLIIDLYICRLLTVLYLQFEDVDQFLAGDVAHNNPLETTSRPRGLGLNLGKITHVIFTVMDWIGIDHIFVLLFVC